MLSILGDNINRLRLPIIGRESAGSSTGGIWGVITDRVLARPAVLATVTAGALLALAVPVLFLNMGFPSGSKAYHDAVEGKRALQLLEEHFAAGLAAPAYVLVDPTDGNVDSVQGSVTRLIDSLKRDAAFIEPFRVNVNQAGDLLLVQAPMVADSNASEAKEAVRRLRQEIVPDAFEGDNASVYVSGATAGSIDFVDNMNGRVPYVFGFVLGLAFLLLMVMFRSIVIPVKAIALNLLSVGAAYGVLVLVFQQGWGIGLLGIETTGVVTAWLPVFLFAMLFGLSMDYHMLLLGRIKELHDQGLSNEAAVSEGIKVTAGQITSAAAVMVGVFAAFALSRGVELKQFGLGMGVAVLIDATIIRSVLLPASMTLLGDRNWYLPSWLEWLPKIGVGEGGDTEPQPAAQPAYGVGTASAGGDA
jgi:RND superfamily putative drug exporter